MKKVFWHILWFMIMPFIALHDKYFNEDDEV